MGINHTYIYVYMYVYMYMYTASAIGARFSHKPWVVFSSLVAGLAAEKKCTGVPDSRYHGAQQVSSLSALFRWECQTSRCQASQ